MSGRVATILAETRKERARAMALQGLSPKEIAAELDVTHSSACRMLAEVGVSPMYVTTDERNSINAGRGIFTPTKAA